MIGKKFMDIQFRRGAQSEHQQQRYRQNFSYPKYFLQIETMLQI